MYDKILSDIIHQKKARNFAAVELLFDIYFKTLRQNKIDEVLEAEFIEEFIDHLIKKNNIDLSEDNPIYVTFSEAKQNIEDKSLTNTLLTQFEENVRKLYTYMPHSIIHWGNYKGHSIAQIAAKDPDYILWCIINLDHFCIYRSFFLNPNITSNTSYLEAVEKNSVKQLIINNWPSDDDGHDHDGWDNDDNGPGSYGYDSWDEMAFNTAFEGDIDAWNHYNQ